MSLTEKFYQSGAIQGIDIRGSHFVLSSGWRTRIYCQCALALQKHSDVEQYAEPIADTYSRHGAECVVAIAMGGLVIGQEVARQLDARFIFAEKEGEALKFRRGFSLRKGERVIIVDDVLTKGGSMKKAIDLVDSYGGILCGLAVLVDRSATQFFHGFPLKSIFQLTTPIYHPDELPPDMKRIPPTKPGSETKRRAVQ